MRKTINKRRTVRKKSEKLHKDKLELTKAFMSLSILVIGGLLAIGINNYANINISEWHVALVLIGASLFVSLAKFMFAFEYTDKLQRKRKYLNVDYFSYFTFFLGIAVTFKLVIDLVNALKAAL